MVHIRSKEFIVNQNLGILDAAQAQHDASERAGQNDQDYGIFGQGFLGGSGSNGSNIGQTLLNTGLKEVLSLLKDAAKSGGKQLFSKVAQDEGDAAQNTAQVANDKADLARITQKITQQLTQLGLSQDQITAFIAGLNENAEKTGENINANSQTIKDNNAGIKTNQDNIQQDKKELETYYNEDDELFDPLKGKLIMGSEGYSSKPFAMPKFDNNVTGVGSNKGRNKKTDKTRAPKKTNEPKAPKKPNKTDKTDKSDKKQRVAELTQDIQENQNQMNAGMAANQNLVDQMNNDIMLQREFMEGNEDAFAQMQNLQDQNMGVMDDAATEYTSEQADELKTSTDAATNLGDGAVDVGLSGKELVMGDGLLVAGIPLLAVPATAPVGQQAETKGGEKVANGTANIGPSGAVVAHEVSHLGQIGINFAENISSWAIQTGVGSAINAALGNDVDTSGMLNDLLATTIESGSEAVSEAMTGGSDNGDKKEPEQNPVT